MDELNEKEFSLEDGMVKLYLMNSNIPSQYLQEIHLKAENEDDYKSFKKLQEVMKRSDEFINGGNNLLIYSEYTGNGKTSWAVKIARAFIEEYACKYMYYDNPVFFVNVPSYIELCKKSMSDPTLVPKLREFEKNIENAKLVIWDDLALKGLTEYEKNTLYVCIDKRTSEYKSNIYTINALIDQLDAILGARISDRVLGYSHKIKITGQTRRNVDKNGGAK